MPEAFPKNSPNEDDEFTYGEQSDAADEPVTELSEEETEEERVSYEILKGFYNTVTKKEISDEDLRTKYLRLTDKLIYEIERAEPDYVVYLDKSARPLAWLVREFWGEFAEPVLSEPDNPDSELVTPPMPGTKFVNIDREQWRSETGSQDTGMVDVSKVPQKDIEELRAIFLKGQRDPSQSAFDQETLFDGKHIMIVDEVKSSGDTLAIAQQLFARAFPGTEIEGRWWTSPPVVNQKTSELPVWYREDTHLGREVDNRSVHKPAPPVEGSHSERQIEGYKFLSTRPEQVDRLARQLRAEIGQLHEDVENGEQRVRRTLERN